MRLVNCTIKFLKNNNLKAYNIILYKGEVNYGK